MPEPTKEELHNAIKNAEAFADSIPDLDRKALLADWALSDSNKIVVKSRVRIYIDLDMLFDRYIGAILYSIHTQYSPEDTAILLEYISETIKALGDEYISRPYDDIEKYFPEIDITHEEILNVMNTEPEIWMFVPLTNCIQLLNTFINALEPVFIEGKIEPYDVVDLTIGMYGMNLEDNVEFTETLCNLLIEMLHVKAESITFDYQDSVIEYFKNDKLRFDTNAYFISNLKSVLADTKIMNDFSTVTSTDKNALVYSNKYIVARQTLYDKETASKFVSQEHINNEMIMLQDYMNLFTNFFQFHVSPIIYTETDAPLETYPDMPENNEFEFDEQTEMEDI